MGILNERIKERRLSLGLTLLEVAELLGVKEATAQRYESGEIKNIKHETIVSLSKILSCSPAFLMGWQDNVMVESSLSKKEIELLQIYRSFDSEGKTKLLDRALELKQLGHVEKGDVAKMA